MIKEIESTLHGMRQVTVAAKPVPLVVASLTILKVRAPVTLLAVMVGGREVPVYTPSSGAAVVVPL
ncbi:hypothetical protein D9M68_846840 [compost metagenome]